MNKLTHVLLVAMVSLLAACSVEKETGDPSGMGGKDTQEVRQEVQLTFKNKLAITQATTKAGDTPLATVAENAVTALDVYVFASDSENGNYTFQERFAYRENDAELPAGSKELTLESGSKENEFTALLSLQKGLFVKLYCIANQPLLVDPANEGNPVTDTYFQPLVQTTPGEAGSRVANEGVPSESLFQSFHTPLLQEASAADTLVCPLPMAGAYTVPLDLTDYSVSSRMQIGFKLTRAVARFDVVNQASVSNFTIESISLGKGRKGSAFFPIQVYGTQPEAASGELITYPFRTFYGEKANAGVQSGAFYSYGSPSQDHGYLILKGKYRINRTEEKEVRYEVPFSQTDGNGNGAYLDIEPNHRYIVAITAADEYRLQTSITLADWEEGASVDDYTPENSAGEIVVSIPTEFAGDTEYKADSRTVSMSLKPDSKFAVSVDASVALAVSKTYIGGLAAKQYDWLEISEPAITNNSVTAQSVTTKSAPANYGYTFSLKENYTLGRYPRATIRFTNLADGTESFFFVEAVSAPQVVEIPKTPGDTNPNSFSVDSLTASLYRITGSQVQVKIACPDGIEVESQPDWLDVEIDSQTGAETVYRLTLNNRDVAGVPDNKGTVTFRNTKVNELKTDITVKLLDASLNPLFNSASLSGINSFDAPADGKSGNVNMQISQDNTFTITCASMRGIEVNVDFDGGPEWLTHTGDKYAKAALQTKELTFSLDTAKIGAAKKATVTLINKIGGRDTAFTVTPVFLAPTVTYANGNVPTQNTMSGSTIKLYQVAGSKVNVKAAGLGGTYIKEQTGVTVTGGNSYSGENTYTVTWSSGSTGSFVIANKSDESKNVTISVNAPSAAITATANMNLNTQSAANVSNTINSPEGCTASVNWGSGGQAWFDLSATTLNTGNQALKITAKSTIATLTNIQKATITLTNKIAGGGNKTFTVTPIYLIQTVEQTSSTGNNLNGTTINMVKMSGNSGYHAQIALKVVSLGGSKASVSGTGLKLVGSASNTAYTATYTVDAAYNAAASGTLTITNYSNSGNSKVFAISVKDGTVTYTSKSTGKTYPALEMNKYWVAPVTEGLANYNDALTKCPDGWRLPVRTDFQEFVRNDKQNMIDKFLAGADPAGKGLGDDAKGCITYWGSGWTGTHPYSITVESSQWHWYTDKDTSYCGCTANSIVNVRCIKNK